MLRQLIFLYSPLLATQHLSGDSLDQRVTAVFDLILLQRMYRIAKFDQDIQDLDHLHNQDQCKRILEDQLLHQDLKFVLQNKSIEFY